MSSLILNEGKLELNDTKKRKKTSIGLNIKKNFFLYLLVIPGIIYFLVFKYLPMVGLPIAFEDFNYIKGVFGSQFVGLKNFEFFFTSNDWIGVTFNTIYLNILFIISGLIFSILIALVLSEIKGKMFVKITQSVSILPNFLSWTLISVFTYSLFASDIGFINGILRTLHLGQINFFQDPSVWPVILVILRIWKGAGFGSVIYLATISGIDQEIYEAAKIDGASRVQCIVRITLPHLKTTAIMLTIFGIGGIFHGDFGMVYALIGDNPLLYSTTDIIDTYVYRQLRMMGDISMSAAVGFYQSFVGLIIVLVSNYIANKLDKDSAIF